MYDKHWQVVRITNLEIDPATKYIKERSADIEPIKSYRDWICSLTIGHAQCYNPIASI